MTACIGKIFDKNCLRSDRRVTNGFKKALRQRLKVMATKYIPKYLFLVIAA